MYCSCNVKWYCMRVGARENQTLEVTRIELIKACKSHPEIAQMLGIPENLRDSARSQFEQVCPGFTLIYSSRHGVAALLQYGSFWATFHNGF